MAVEGVLIGGIHPALEGRVDALGDVRGLLVKGADNAAGRGVEAVFGPGVPDARDGLANDGRNVHVGGGADLA